MSGHNRWSKVKNIKGPADAKRGKLFTKLIKEVIVAARMGGGDPAGNARLRQALTAARQASIPKDTIERGVKKGTGELEGDAVEEMLYEGYGPGGVAILVETASDNKNRTVSDLRNLFKNNAGNLGEAGSVAWMFSHYGQLVFEKSKYPEDKVMEVALEAGAADVSESAEVVEVLTDPVDVYRVREFFEKVGMHPTTAGFSYVAKTSVPVEDKELARKVLHLLEQVEDHDDMQRVHANFEMEETLFGELAAEK